MHSLKGYDIIIKREGGEQVRKIKNGAKKPPLSLLDKTIYIILVLLGFAMLLVMMLGMGLFLPKSIAFADDTIVASYNPAVICALPLTLLIALGIAFLAGRGIDNKQPIFGNKHFKPAGLKPVIKTYPLFSKEFRENLSNGTKRKIKKTVKILLILLIVFSVIYSLGIFPRTVLDKYNNCTSYNMFNNETHRCNITEAEKLVIDIYHNIHYRNADTWGIRLEFSCAHKTHKFTLGSFYEMNTEDTLNYMIYLKSLLSGRYEITNIDRMEKLIWDRGFSAKETQLVYELFDYEAA